MKKIKRIIAMVLAIVLTLTMIPQTNLQNVNAATLKAPASVPTLGYTNNPIKIGNKEQGTKWNHTNLKINNIQTPVFCLDLGETCKTGDEYSFNYTSGTNAWITYSSSNVNEEISLIAYIGDWYYNNGKPTKQRWVYAQALIWAVREGVTSKNGLTDIIRALNNDPVTYGSKNYKSSRTATRLYSDIFESGEATVSVRKWVNENNNRQDLLEIVGEYDVEYKKLTETKKYRQRVTIYKEDDLGNALQGAEFKLAVKNVMELDEIKIGNGQESTTETDTSGTTTFEMSGQTGKNGLLWWKITYSMETQEYGYIPDNELSKMNADEKAAVKAKMDDDGISYGPDLSKNSAEGLAASELYDQLNRIKNKYVLTEVSSGNPNILVSTDYANGKELVLGPSNTWFKVERSDGSKVWPETENGTYYDFSQAFIIRPLKNNSKKYTITVQKEDGYSADGKPYGEASLKGAVYMFYDDEACTKLSTFYKANDNPTEAAYVTDENGKFETDYMVGGKKYYLKEYRAPEGYLLDDTVYEVTVDMGTVNVEHTRNVQTVVVNDEPVLGTFSLNKYHGASATDTNLKPEKGATFQVYLKSKGSYDACSDYERDTLVTDENGFAKSKDLYYGVYTLHQVDCGPEADTILIDDQGFAILRDGDEITESYINIDFTAYLRIVKKLKETNETVLKPDSSFQIYRVDSEGNETKIVQTYIEDNEEKTTDTFTTDETGLVETYRPLPSGTYRVYETNGAEGTHKVTEFYEITINSKSDNYVEYTDAEGNVYYEIEVDYVNESTKGKFTVSKTGEKLVSFDKENGFVYEKDYLDGTVFELYATEDVATADGHETLWFNKGDLVATITTGEGATFTSECNGICTYELDENGNVIVTLPIGSYELKETDAVYGYIYPAENTFGLEFKWINFEDEYVLNNTESTDENGVVNVYDDRAKASISIYKHTKGNIELPVPNTTFDFCTKTDIYNKDGEIIAPADTVLTTVRTDKTGNAVIDIDVPLMSEGYTEGSTGLNSGDYYFKEVSVSDSYFLNETPVYVHLEYVDSATPVIEANAVQANEQTHVEFNKVKLANNEELDNAHLEIRDSKGNTIISWISGDKESIKIAEIVQNLQYENLTAEMDEKGNLIAHGLLHDEEYTLVETKPADGFVTADPIKFKLLEREVSVTPEGSEEETTEGETTTEETTTEEETTPVIVLAAEEITTEANETESETTEEEISTTSEEETTEGEASEEDTTEEKEVMLTVVYVYNSETKTYEAASENKVVMKDDTTKVYISKKDITDEEEQEGNKLEIRDEEGNLIEAWTSTNEPRYFEQKFVVGKQYTLIETKPIDGYTTATSITFVVKDTGNIQTVTMTNTPTQVEFSKKTITGSEEIPGCMLKVVRKATGEEIDAWTSTNEPHIIKGKLIIGETYIMSETKPADGYATATDIEFVVSDNLGELQTVTMKDDTIKVKIVKVDAKDNTKKLKDAKFAFINSDGKTVAKVTTDANGEALVEGKLIAGDKLTIREVKAPAGYELAPDISYTIKDTGDIQVITVKDKSKTTQTGIFMKSFSFGIVIITIVVGMFLVLFGGKRRKNAYK